MIDFLLSPSSLDALAWTLIHFLWQGALLAAIAFAALRLARPEQASTRYLIGVTTLAAMLVACVATFTVLARQPARVAPDSPSIEVPWVKTDVSDYQLTINDKLVERHTSSTPLRISLADIASFRPAPLPPTAMALVVTLWALGVFALSLRLLGGWMLTRRLTREAVDAVPPAVSAAARLIAERLRLRRAVAIVESGAVVVPTLVGWVRPVVLLPAVALSGLTPEQLQAILAHELAHVRRHDYLINLLQSIVETLLFYHPAMWWVSAQVRSEREHCCDDIAVDVCGDRLVYVSALAELTSIASHRAFALAATDGSLVGRVQRLLGRPRTVAEPAPAWALLALFVLIVGSIGTFRAAAPEPVPQAGDRIAIDSVTPAPTVEHAIDARAFEEEHLRKLENDRARIEHAQLNAEADAAERQILKETAERAAFFSSQWLRGWFDSTQPPPPPAPSAPPAPPAPPAPAPPAPEAPEASPPPPPEAPEAPEARLAPPAPPAPEPPARLAPPAPQAHRAPRAPDAPEAPEAPQAPQAPHPPEEPHAPEVGSRSSGNMSWSNGSEKVVVKWNGAFRLSDDEKDIAWMGDGATLSISDGIVFASKAELRNVNGRIERSFSKNGFRREWEPEGRAFLASAIDRLIRHSGMFAKERVARFLKQGGPDAVLAEIDRLDDSSYIRRVYYSELIKQTTLSDPLLTRVLQRVPNELSSDYDKATLFTAIAKLPAVTESHRVLVAKAARSITSDYDQRRTLHAIMDVTPLPAAVAAAVLDATGSISSNYDRSLVLSEVAERGGLTASTTPAFMTLVRDMSSSYDQRRVLTAVSSQRSIPDAVAAEAIKTTGAMSSSYDQTETLIALIDRGGLNDGSADAFFQSASQISSSHDLSRLLQRVVKQPAMSDRILDGVLRTASRVSSGHERANLLEAIAARARVQGSSRELYLAAAKGLSSYEENRVLAALVRAEGRR